jgi:glycosyltransferase involved in cell wall biosynthesis
MAHVKYRQKGGEEAVFANEVGLLQRYGYDVIPVTYSNEDIQAAGFFGKIRTALTAIWSFKKYREFSELLRREAPDVVHFHNIFPLLSPSVYKACHDQGIPVVQTLHNYRWACPAGTFFRDGSPCELCVKKGLFNAVRHKCYRGSSLASAAVALMIIVGRKIGVFSRYVDKIIVLTQFAQNKMIEAGLPAEKLLVKPNFGLAHPPAYKAEPEYILFIGRVSAEKGIVNLIEAAKLLDKGIKICIAGDGPDRQELERQAVEEKLSIDFLGLLSPTELSGVISRCALVVIPSSWYEGFPMVVLDAYSHRKPILVADIGGLPELVELHKTGNVCDCKDPVLFAKALSDMWNTPVETALMGESGYQKYNNEYSAEANIIKLENIYTKVIDA